MHRGVKFVGFSLAPADDFIHVVERSRQLFRSQAQPQDHRPARRNFLLVVNAGLGARLPRVHAVFMIDDVAVEGVFDIGLAIVGAAIEADRVVLVVREQRFPARRSVKVMRSERVGKLQVVQAGGVRFVGHERNLISGGLQTDGRFSARRIGPCPGVAEPEVRKQVQIGGFRPAVDGLDANANVFRPGFGIFDEDIEVAVFIEDSRVQQFVLRRAHLPPAAPVFFQQFLVRKLALRILVQHLHVTVGRRVVEIEPVFLGVLAVVAFVAREPEHALFEDGIASIPQGQGEDQKLVTIADAGNAVFTPAIGLAARHVVGEKFPGTTVGAVVLAHAAPGTFADVRSPLAPGRDRAGMFLAQPLMLGGVVFHGRIRAPLLGCLPGAATERGADFLELRR